MVEKTIVDSCGVETKFKRLGVETNPGVSRVAVDTKFKRLGVETKLRRLGVETNPGVKRVAVETKLARFAVLTRLSKLGVETVPRATFVKKEPSPIKKVAVTDDAFNAEVLIRVCTVRVDALISCVPC
jgi:hypothetical protein